MDRFLAQLLLFIIPATMLISIAFAFYLPIIRDFSTWKIWHKRLFWLTAYMMPALLVWLLSATLDPQYRYEYGRHYTSMLEVKTSGAITALVIVLAGAWMAPLFLIRQAKVYLDMIFNQALILLLALYHCFTELAFYDPAFVVLPLFYAVAHAVFLMRLLANKEIVVRQMRVMYWPALFTFIPGAIYLKLESARKLFYSLPETPPENCFIVTAATQGHPALVGSWYEAPAGRILNRQLVHFYAFEEKLKHHTPMFHRRLRRVYNRVGPLVARRINTPWKADIAFLLLIPLHILVALLLPFFKKSS